ncbi:MAG: UvrD-helicase domain-containing protein, partial [Neisseriaceae bacterium]|nr:UvrD-helicase domain-containing protein [Neisseriaceae bacterium]
LIKDGTKLSQILIVTYTEKAAGELKDRIRKKIQEVLINGKIIKFLTAFPIGNNYRRCLILFKKTVP